MCNTLMFCDINSLSLQTGDYILLYIITMLPISKFQLSNHLLRKYAWELTVMCIKRI